MLFDFNEAWSRLGEGRYHVCICGTGPAGITAARKLAARGKKVLLLEGGGLTYSEQSQDHYQGKSIGRRVYLESIRLRYLGGTSNHWTGLCALLDPITFDIKDEHGLPGWPISRKEVLSSLHEAKEILDIEGRDLSQSNQPGFLSPSFDRYAMALSPPTRFFEKYGAELKQSNRIDVFYNANVVDIGLGESLGRANSLSVRNYNGQTSKAVANQYVLASGGIENVRILLNANRQVRTGIGNHSDMVGRCFMESLDSRVGQFVVTDADFWQAVRKDENSHGEERRDGEVSLVPTEWLMRQRHVQNGVIQFFPHTGIEEYGRLGALRKFIRETGCSWPSLAELSQKIINFNCPSGGHMQSIIEQVPNLNSRVSLTSDVDSFGLRRVEIDWQLTEDDLKTIRVLTIEAAKEMARLNRARVQLAPFVLDTSLDIPVNGYGHHMGTTRMSADPRYGVVDEDCRVHGIENLYIAGSSVFPTCGGKNPTMTIVLLALRLGEHLAKSS